MTEWELDTKKEYTIDHGEMNCMIMTNAFVKICYLNSKFPELEWMAGLKGIIFQDYILIEDIIIFDQQIGRAKVELTDEGNIEISKRTDIIGWIHSHNTMDVFFSSTDLATSNWNKVSIVVNNKLKFIGKIRQSATIITNGEQIPATVFKNLNLSLHESLLTNEFAQEIDQKIKEYVYQPQVKDAPEKFKDDRDYLLRTSETRIVLVLSMEAANALSESKLQYPTPDVTQIINGKTEYLYTGTKKQIKKIKKQLKSIMDTLFINDQKLDDYLTDKEEDNYFYQPVPETTKVENQWDTYNSYRDYI